jgi:hypothetical protein
LENLRQGDNGNFCALFAGGGVVPGLLTKGMTPWGFLPLFNTTNQPNLMSFPEHTSFLVSLDSVETSRQQVLKAKEQASHAFSQHQEKIDSAASEESPDRSILTSCAESLVAERICTRRVELAEERLAEAEKVSAAAFRVACSEALLRLRDWESGHRISSLDRILGGAPSSPDQQQAAEKLVRDSPLMAQCRQLCLSLNPPPLNGGAGVLLRAVEFLKEQE